MPTREQELMKLLQDHPKAYDLLEAERLKHIGKVQDAAGEGHPPAVQVTATAAHMAEQLRTADPALTTEQSLLRAYEQTPWLYESEASR